MSRRRGRGLSSGLCRQLTSSRDPHGGKGKGGRGRRGRREEDGLH